MNRKSVSVGWIKLACLRYLLISSIKMSINTLGDDESAHVLTAMFQHSLSIIWWQVIVNKSLSLSLSVFATRLNRLNILVSFASCIISYESLNRKIIAWKRTWTHVSRTICWCLIHCRFRLFWSSASYLSRRTHQESCPEFWLYDSKTKAFSLTKRNKVEKARVSNTLLQQR